LTPKVTSPFSSIVQMLCFAVIVGKTLSADEPVGILPETTIGLAASAAILAVLPIAFLKMALHAPQPFRGARCCRR
jgi:hypothetical protein